MANRKSTPSIRRHKPSKQGVVTLNGRDHYLGHWPDGKKKPPLNVQEAYDALISEWLANGRQSISETPDLSVSELILAFWHRHVTVH